MGSTELWPVFPGNHFWPDCLATCATPVHYLQVSVAKTFKASYLQMAKMVLEERETTGPTPITLVVRHMSCLFNSRLKQHTGVPWRLIVVYLSQILQNILQLKT